MNKYGTTSSATPDVAPYRAAPARPQDAAGQARIDKSVRTASRVLVALGGLLLALTAPIVLAGAIIGREVGRDIMGEDGTDPAEEEL
jgi:hypothetical protein